MSARSYLRINYSEEILKKLKTISIDEHIEESDIQILDIYENDYN
jgi:hypothetical protein